MSTHSLPPNSPPLRTWQPLLDLALAEDIGPGDVTTEIVLGAEAKGRARIEARQDLVVCGLFVAEEVFGQVDAHLQFSAAHREGERVAAGDVLAFVEGSMRSILSAERTALNFLGRLSGISTLTSRYRDAVSGTGCQIVDTRKTLPGWRVLDKFAVRAGGGINHRFALFDGILLKDNHVAAAGGVREAMKSARAHAPAGLRIQIEVESLEEAQSACEAGADFLLLDNCSPQQVRTIVKELGSDALLEASGGINLENVREFATAGVHRVSIGALTHSAQAVDVALEIEDGPGRRP
ncbi:MAG: nicotinate-nucleotide diphosphorylase (carboxylating) [bacterium TMED88]|nr:nicotinate-nucleotide diphosphorylase (carboxylating) [Deltaproteobacteria bacterium]OUV26823.1 MAG: nicotinate-nucleotide diphosphorylase (carboxylating) [bacterium TMED88]